MVAQRGAQSLVPKREALVVLVGLTAGRRKRGHLLRYLTAHSDYAVFVPHLPYRKPLRAVAAWLSDYFEREVRPGRYEKTHAIAYIAGGRLLLCLPPGSRPAFERIVYFRGPLQELVPAHMVQRIGRFLTGLLLGQSAADLADSRQAGLQPQRQARQEALIVEEGRSGLARLLGITRADVPAAAWTAEELMPTAGATLYIPDSHDDVYTSDRVLAAALGFIEHGSFPTVERCRPSLT